MTSNYTPFELAIKNSIRVTPRVGMVERIAFSDNGAPYMVRITLVTLAVIAPFLLIAVLTK